jgi:hypothetical protein
MKIAIAFLSLIVAASHAQAATQTCDWPCKQRKVPEIAIAATWRGPSLETASQNWRDDKDVASLVALLAARRTTDEEATKVIAEFAKSAGAEKESRLLTAVVGLFELRHLRPRTLRRRAKGHR